MGCHQTTRGGEYRPFTVALNASALKNKVETIDIFALQGPLVVELTVQGIVEFGRELLAPAIEAEVEQAGMPLVID